MSEDITPLAAPPNPKRSNSGGGGPRDQSGRGVGGRAALAQAGGSTCHPMRDGESGGV